MILSLLFVNWLKEMVAIIIVIPFLIDVVWISVHHSLTVQEHSGNEKSCVWHASDFADGELKDELFCIRFPSVESESLGLVLLELPCWILF